MLVQDLPKIYNRFHSYQLETNISIDYPKGEVILSGTQTQATLEHRKTGDTLTLDIFSKEPLRPHQLRAAINQATGDHWQYRTLTLACFDYEF
ncbi:MAG: hypothetical protein ACKN9E_08255 [Microcystaceae cyanobacterium]